MRMLNLYAEELRPGDFIISGLGHGDGDEALPVESIGTVGAINAQTTIEYAAHNGCGPSSIKVMARDHVTVLRPEK